MLRETETDECMTCDGAGVLESVRGDVSCRVPCPDCAALDDPPDHIDWSGLTWRW